MFQQKIHHSGDVPLRQKERNCTDIICTIIAGIFALTLFIIAFVMLRKDNFYKTNFPTDSDKNPCAYGENQQFAFVYFPNIDDINTRVCVSSCPKASDLEIQCKANSQVPDCLAVNIYETGEHFKRLGGFCMPEDEGLRNKLIQNANLSEKMQFTKLYDIAHIAILIAILIGVVWMILVQALPKIINYVAVFLASVILVVTGILILANQTNGWEGKEGWRIIIGVFLLIFGILFMIMLVLYHRHLRMIGILLKYAGQFLSERPQNYLYILLFLIFTVAHIVLCTFQYLAYTSNSDPQPKEGDIYLHSTPNVPLSILNLIQFIWGLQFLKDSFNFIISGNATQWYMREDKKSNCCISFSRLIKFNFGSVAGGSFLNGFFNFIDFLFQIVRCYPDGYCGACAPCCSKFSSCCGCFFDLVRNDAYAYINLTGIPYCNAARNVQVLCRESPIFIGTQSVMFLYRLCSHVFCIGLVVLFCYWFMELKTGQISVFTLILIILFSYCLSTYFLSIHADAAEGIQVSYLLERQLNGNTLERHIELQGLKRELQEMEKDKQRGKC